MANPSLKAQIEAAKSALATGLAAPSLAVQPPEQPATPIMAGNGIATGAATKSTNTNSDNAANPIPASSILAEEKLAHSTNAAVLDKRITRLEAKLLENQRDLNTLLQKIREVSRLQDTSGQNHKNPATDHTKTMPMDKAEDTAVPRRSQRSPLIMVAMAALTGLVVGVAFFLAPAKGDPSVLTVLSWISTIFDSFNGWIG